VWSDRSREPRVGRAPRRFRGALPIDDALRSHPQVRTLPRDAEIEQIAFIYQEQIRIESYLRRGDEWMDAPIIITGTLASLSVPAVGASISIADIYDGLAHLLRG